MAGLQNAIHLVLVRTVGIGNPNFIASFKDQSVAIAGPVRVEASFNQLAGSTAQWRYRPDILVSLDWGRPRGADRTGAEDNLIVAW